MPSFADRRQNIEMIELWQYMRYNGIRGNPCVGFLINIATGRQSINMGMTRVFYMVKKNQLTSEKIRKMMSEASDNPYYTVFYQDTIDWLPVFDEFYCEGQYHADREFMESLEAAFGSPVIALSTFDSDVAFVSVCKSGELHRYVQASMSLLEEFGFEEYEPAIPAKLEDYVDGEALQEIWNKKYVLAEERLEDLTQLLNTFLVFEENFVDEDVEMIYCEWLLVPVFFKNSRGKININETEKCADCRKGY